MKMKTSLSAFEILEEWKWTIDHEQSRRASQKKRRVFYFFKTDQKEYDFVLFRRHIKHTLPRR